jgi:proteasome lid subunit RPN8/RPN11
MIRLGQDHMEAITAHAERDYPHECGGLLLGLLEGENKTVVETLPMENTAEVERRHDLILIEPRAVFKAERLARQKGLDIIGYYHSHPEDEAAPSQFDLDHAMPVWSYIIASVREGKTVDVRSWQMENDRSVFNAEEMIFEVEKAFGN